MMVRDPDLDLVEWLVREFVEQGGWTRCCVIISGKLSVNKFRIDTVRRYILIRVQLHGRQRMQATASRSFAVASPPVREVNRHQGHTQRHLQTV